MKSVSTPSRPLWTRALSAVIAIGHLSSFSQVALSAQTSSSSSAGFNSRVTVEDFWNQSLFRLNNEQTQGAFARSPSAVVFPFEIQEPQGPKDDPELQKKLGAFLTQLTSFRESIIGGEKSDQQPGQGFKGAVKEGSGQKDGQAKAAGPTGKGLLGVIAEKYEKIRYENPYRILRKEPSFTDKEVVERFQKAHKLKNETEKLLSDSKLSGSDKVKVLTAYAAGVILPLRDLLWVLGHRNPLDVNLGANSLSQFMVAVPIGLPFVATTPKELTAEEKQKEQEIAEKQKEFLEKVEKFFKDREETIRTKTPALQGFSETELGKAIESLRPPKSASDALEYFEKDKIEEFLTDSGPIPLTDSKGTPLGVVVSWPSGKNAPGKTSLAIDASALTQPYLEVLKNVKTPHSYVLSLKALTVQTMLIQQLMLSRITQDPFPITIPEQCKSGMFEGFPDQIWPEGVTEENNENLIKELLVTQGLVLETPPPPILKTKEAGDTSVADDVLDQITSGGDTQAPSTPPPQAQAPGKTAENASPSSDPLFERLGAEMKITPKGLRMKNPYGQTPFEIMRAAEWGLNKKRDIRLEPGIDDLTHFEEVFDLKAIPGRAYLENMKIPNLVGPLFSRVSREVPILDENGEAKNLVAKNWPEYLTDLIIKDPENANPEALMCEDGKSFLKNSWIDMPAPKLRGPPSYRDWALQLITQRLADLLAQANNPQFEQYFRLLEKTPEFCNGDLCEGGVKKGVEKLLGILAPDFKVSQRVPLKTGSGEVGAKEVTPLQFVPFYQASSIPDLLPYELNLVSVWSFLINSRILDQRHGALQTEWDYITEDFFSNFENPWKRFRFSIVHAALCTNRFPYERTAKEQKFIFDKLPFTTGGQISPLKFPSVLLGLMGEGRCDDNPDPVKCALSKTKIYPYHANRILTAKEKQIFWKAKTDETKNNESLSLFSTPVDNPTTGSQNYFDEFENLFSEPLILNPQRVSEVIKKYQLDSQKGILGRKFNKEIRDQVEEIKKTESGFIAAEFSKIFEAQGNLQRQRNIFESIRNSRPEYIEKLDVPALRSHFVVADQLYRKMLNIELLRKAARDRRAYLEKSLRTLCELKPNIEDEKSKDNEEFRQIVVNTFVSQEKLNKLWGVETTPDSVLAILQDDQYPWSSVLYFVGAYLGMSITWGGCAAVALGTFGAGGALCSPLAAFAFAAWAGYLQTGLFIYEWDQLKAGERRVELSEDFKKLGFTNDEGQALGQVHSYFDFGMELVTGVPIIGVGTKFAGAATRRVVGAAESINYSRFGLMPWRTGIREALLPNATLKRTLPLAESLRHLRLVPLVNSLVPSQVQARLTTLTQNEITKGLGDGLAFVFENDYGVFRKFLRKYSNPTLLAKAERNLEAYRGTDALSLGQRILSVNGAGWPSDRLANRAVRRLNSGKNIQNLLADLRQAEQRGVPLNKFFAENSDEIADLIYENPYVFRDGFFEAIFQSGATAEYFETVATLGLNQVARRQLSQSGNMNSFAGAVSTYGIHKWLPTTQMFRNGQAKRIALAYQHASMELQKLNARKILGYGDEIKSLSTFEVVKGFRNKSSEILATLNNSGDRVLTKEFLAAQEAFEREIIERFQTQWVKETQGNRASQELLDLLKPENASTLKEVLFNPASLAQEHLSRALWGGIKPETIFSIPEIENSAQLVLKYFNKLDDTSQFETLVNALKTLSYSKRLPDQVF